MKKLFIPVYLTLMTALWINSWTGFRSGAPLLAILGSLITTSAPIAFLIRQLFFRPSGAEPHRVWVSVISGLGAVMIIVAIYRFGDQHSFWMSAALISLGGWIAYLKLSPVHADPTPSDNGSAST